MTPAIIDITAMWKTFGTQAVLYQLDWQVAPGKVIGLLGRNGAGKSTLMECMLGLRETDAGSCRLFGEPVASLSDTVRARIGYVPQKPDLFEWMTPRQMLAYFKPLYPRWNGAKVDGLLARWDLGGARLDKQIGKLSVGQKQRLSIIRALAHEPELLVLDEPVASLDPAGRRDFLRELIDSVIEHGTTVVFSTHILSDLERVAIDVAFLKDGRIALQSPLDDLMDSARRVTGPSALLDGMRLTGEIRRERASDGRLGIIARPGPQEIAALQVHGNGVRIDAMNLEDLFVEVTK